MNRRELMRLCVLVVLLGMVVIGSAGVATAETDILIPDPVVPLNPGMINSNAMNDYFNLDKATDQKSLKELLGNTPSDPAWVIKLLTILTDSDFEQPPTSPAQLTHEECRAYLMDKDLSLNAGYAPVGIKLSGDKKKTTLILEWSRFRRYQVPYRTNLEKTGKDNYCRFRYGVAARMVLHTLKEGGEFSVANGCLGLGVKANVTQVKCDYQLIGFGSADASRALPALVDLSDDKGVRTVTEAFKVIRECAWKCTQQTGNDKVFYPQIIAVELPPQELPAATKNK